MPPNRAARTLRLVCLLLPLAVVAANAAAADSNRLTVRDLPGGAFSIRNAFTTVELAPAEGGRIRKLTLETSGDDLLYWDPKEFLGGLLDDKATTASALATDVLTRDDTRFVVRMTGQAGADLTVVKTLSFRADTPVIRADLRYENRGQTDLSRALFMRNFIRPSGTDITTEDIYCFAMSEGIVQASTADLARHPDLSGQMHSRIASPWRAFVSRSRRQGVAVVFLDDALEAFYEWTSSVAYPTFEWYYRTLPAGRALETSLLVVPLSGMSGVRFVNAEIAVNWTGTGIVATALQKSLSRVSLHVRDLDERSNLLAAHPPVKLDRLHIGQATRVAAALPRPAANARIREFHIKSGSPELGVFQDVVTGAKPESGVLERSATPAARLTPLPDWRPESPFAPVIGEAEKRRGYAIYSREGERAGHAISGLRFDLAPGLRESQMIGIWPLRDATEVSVRAVHSPSADERWLDDHVLVRIERPAPMPPNRGGLTGSVYQLRPVGTFTPTRDQESRLWITLRGQDMAAGDYRFTLSIAANDAAPCDVPVHVKVWPVSLPQRRRVSLEMEHCLALLPGCNYMDALDALNAPDAKRSMEAIDAYTRNLAEHGVDFAQFYPFTGNVWRFIRIKGTDRTLAQAINDPNFLDRDPLPDLDFSFFNPWLDTAFRNGLTRLATNGGAIANVPTPSEKLDRWFWSQALRYVLSRGYRPEDCFVKVWDEQPNDQIPALAAEMQRMKLAGWRTYSTYSTLFRYPNLTRVVDAASDMYQFGGWPAREYEERLDAGDISPDSEMWVYYGWATAWRSYQAMRAAGWEAAFSRLDGFHGHEYYRWTDLACAAIVTIEDDRPVDSPAWEGMADGLADAQLLAELLHRLDGGRRLRGRLADETDTSAAVIAPVCGSSEGAILPIRRRVLERGLKGVVVVDPEDIAGTSRYRHARRAVLELLCRP